ncbi:hypothetical protein CYMTET_37533 [Cymbomonas tetramitiformis]|uniref:Uncharacterized protein n=1 Tax=Cymbomonas tetramitiformis TaxID=36881 RepID=A0AAE0CFI2_9CHLO|nr:hypothetical protein CYMTET_37533 [Cymbomonas tetramitiformis]
MLALGAASRRGCQGDHTHTAACFRSEIPNRQQAGILEYSRCRFFFDGKGNYIEKEMRDVQRKENGKENTVHTWPNSLFVSG